MADPARPVDECLVEPALVWLVGFFVAEVPLPEDAGSVARRPEDLRQDRGLEGHALALEDGVSNAILERMPARHDGGAGG